MTTTPFNLSHTSTWEVRETAEYKLMTRGTMAVSDLEFITLVGKKATATRLLTHLAYVAPNFFLAKTLDSQLSKFVFFAPMWL